MYYERPELEKGSKTYICPRCGEMTLKRYVQYGKHIHESVGRCNRESSCIYHKRPREYWAENNIKVPKLPTIQKQTPKPQEIKPIGYIPMSYITNRAKTRNHYLIYYMLDLFDRETIKRGTDLYFLGCTSGMATVFPQIDEQGRCRTAKEQLYNKDTGKRVKNSVNWLHAELKKWEELPQDFNLQMCLFGLHLIRSANNAGKTICICESEKSAVIAACCMPQYIWMAAGAKGWLNVEKLKPLKGWNVVLFPDTATSGDAFILWSKIAEDANKQGLNVIVSDMLEKECTAEQKAAGYDIADYLIDKILESKQAIEPEAQEEPQQVESENISDTLKEMIRLNPAVQTLIDNFGAVEV